MADFRKSLLFRDEKEKWQDLTANERESTRMDSLEKCPKCLFQLDGFAFIGVHWRLINSALVNLYQFACWLPKPCHG